MPGIFPGSIHRANNSVPSTGDSGALVSNDPRWLTFEAGGQGDEPYWAHTVMDSGSGLQHVLAEGPWGAYQVGLSFLIHKLLWLCGQH